MAQVNKYALDNHADRRISGQAPHQSKKIWGKLYIIPNNINELLRWYHRDFDETKLGDWLSLPVFSDTAGIFTL